MRTKGWDYKSTKALYVSDKDLLETWGDYKVGDKSYGEYYIEYKNILKGIIANCKSGQLILVNIHAGFPQAEEEHAIVYKDSYAYQRLIGTDDFNVVVDIDEHFEILKNGAKNL